jgi:sirohydrochlorin ferrochelatase
MIKNLIISASVTSLVLISFPVIVFAQENEATNQPEQIMQITNLETSEDSTMAESINVDDRIKKLKEKATEKITIAQSRRIEARCSNAQTKLTNISARLAESIEKRRTIYLASTTRLSDLVQKLQAANVDTVELETAISEMTTLVTNSLDSADTYVQSLADITEMECSADPEGFKAVLDEARQKRVEIVSYQSQIQAIKNEKIKPILQTIRESLSNSETTTEESGE